MNISPQEVVDEGKKYYNNDKIYRVIRKTNGATVGEYASGEIVKLVTAAYNVEFKPVPYWVTPDPVTNVNIKPSHTQSSPLIIRVEYPRPYITVRIRPPEISDDAQWKIIYPTIPSTDLIPSGERTRIDESYPVIRFTNVSAWCKPADYSVPEIFNDFVIDGPESKYTPKKISLTVYVNYESVNNDTEGDDNKILKWRILQEPDTWYDSGVTKVFKGMNYVNVNFDNSNDFYWITPDNFRVDLVCGGGSESQTRTYIRKRGNLKVVFKPADVRECGLWRVVGRPWHHSGEIEYEIPTGWAYLKFRTFCSSNWIFPVGGKAPITYNETRLEIIEIPNTDPGPMSICDFLGDGKSDVSVYRPSNGAWLIHGSNKIRHGRKGDRPAPGDYDGDGVADAAVYRPDQGKWLIRGWGAIKFGKESDIPVPGDYNGDGITDIAVYDRFTSTWSVQGIFNVVFGREMDIPVPADYNGDGITDIAVFRPSEGKWLIQDIGIFKFGQKGDTPVPADYNGDGATDIAVFRRSEGKWLIRGRADIQFGAEGDIPTPGDYDGDGKADIAVFNEENGLWRVYGLFEIQFGRKGDIPLVRGK